MDSVAHPLAFPHAEPPVPGQTIQIAPGVLWMRLPLPYRLDHVNIYLLEDNGGWAVLDTGLATSACRAGRPLWRAAAERPLVSIISHPPIPVMHANAAIRRFKVESPFI